MSSDDVDVMFKCWDESNTDTAGVSLEDWWAGYKQMVQAIKEMSEAK